MNASTKATIAALAAALMIGGVITLKFLGGGGQPCNQSICIGKLQGGRTYVQVTSRDWAVGSQNVARANFCTAYNDFLGDVDEQVGASDHCGTDMSRLVMKDKEWHPKHCQKVEAMVSAYDAFLRSIDGASQVPPPEHGPAGDIHIGTCSIP